MSFGWLHGPLPLHVFDRLFLRQELLRSLQATPIRGAVGESKSVNLQESDGVIIFAAGGIAPTFLGGMLPRLCQMKVLHAALPL